MSSFHQIPERLSKEEKYKALLPQIKALLEGENDPIANLSNAIAAIKEPMNFFWIGYYFVKGSELVLGPFQGSVACTRIGFGKGVCGTAWKEKKTIVVENVDEFPGHIACSSLSKSEIVIPAFNGKNEVSFVLDVDSTKLSDFDKTDVFYLEQIVRSLEKINP